MKEERYAKWAGAEIIPIADKLERTVVEIKYIAKLHERNYSTMDLKSAVEEKLKEAKLQLSELEKVLEKL